MKKLGLILLGAVIFAGLVYTTRGLLRHDYQSTTELTTTSKTDIYQHIGFENTGDNRFMTFDFNYKNETNDVINLRFVLIENGIDQTSHYPSVIYEGNSCPADLKLNPGQEIHCTVPFDLVQSSTEFTLKVFNDNIAYWEGEFVNCIDTLNMTVVNNRLVIE